MTNLKKSLKIWDSLTKSQKAKLEKDLAKNESINNIQIEKINSMLSSGFYALDKKKILWLHELKDKYINKSSMVEFVFNNGYNYINL